MDSKEMIRTFSRVDEVFKPEKPIEQDAQAESQTFRPIRIQSSNPDAEAVQANHSKIDIKTVIFGLGALGLAGFWIYKKVIK